MSPSVFIWFLVVALPALAGLAVSEHWLATDTRLPAFARPAIAWGLLALVGYVVFWAYFAHPALGRGFVLALFAILGLQLLRIRRHLGSVLFATNGNGGCRLLILMIGLGTWLLIVFPFAVWRSKLPVPASLKRNGLRLVGWSLLSLLVWIGLMFGPATTSIHQGSLAPLLVLWAVPAAALLRWRAWIAWPLAAVQLGLLIGVWVPRSDAITGPLAPLFLSVALLCGLVMAAAAIAAYRPSTP